MDSDQFKLETLHRSTNSPQRPTIPYSQFPRPTLQKLSTAVEIRRGSQSSVDAGDSPLTAESVDLDFDSSMDPISPSSHRRRMTVTKDSSRGPGKRSGELRGASGSGEGSPALAEDLKSTSDGLRIDYMSDEDGLHDDEETGLTERDSGKRKNRKKRNTQLDHRVAGNSGITDEEKKEADQNIIKKMAINVLLIGSWYLFSLSISIYNKWMFDPKHLDFHFPLFTTCMHMLVQFALASLVLYLFPQFRPRYDSITNPHNTSVSESDWSRHEANRKKPLMTQWFYVTRLGPCGMATGLDIGLGNMSLQFISLTFYTMCKSSALGFVLLFAFVFRLETPSWRLIGIIATMTLGVIMMVAGEVHFKPIGFVLVILAAFFSGFRWGLTQILLLRNPATSNPFSSIFYLAPIMFLTLLILAIPFEGFYDLSVGLGVLVEKKGMFVGPLILLAPGVMAFLMTSSEFALLQRTSVVTLSIAGIFKEVVTILAAGRVFNDTMTAVNFSGLCVTLAAIVGYNYIKITKMRKEARVEVHMKNALNAEQGIDGNENEGGNGQYDLDPDDDDLKPKSPRSPSDGKGSTSLAPLMGDHSTQ